MDREMKRDRHEARQKREMDKPRDLEELNNDGSVETFVVFPGYLGRLVVRQSVVLLVRNLRPHLNL